MRVEVSPVQTMIRTASYDVGVPEGGQIEMLRNSEGEIELVRYDSAGRLYDIWIVGDGEFVEAVI